MGIKISIILFFIAFMLILYVIYYKLHFEKYIARKLNMQCLGYIPLNTNPRNLVIQNNSKSNLMEYFSDIRNNILSIGKKQIISIISCDKEEGKSFIANNLSISLARINKKVLLIDCNLRKVSNKNEIFYLDSVEGLSDFIRSINIEDTLSNLYKTKKYILQTQIPNLYILQNGTITVNSSELLKSDKFRLLLNLLKEMYDYIIIDGTSFYENEDSLTISSIADNNIFIIDKNKFNFNDLNYAKNQIYSNNGKILGFILNKTNIKFGKYYGKKIQSKFELSIENIHPDKNKQSIDDLINPLAKKIQKNNLNKFERLHQELRDNVLVEDFINDIEVNFNLKLDTINDSCKNSNNKIDLIFQKLEENKNSLNNSISGNSNRIEEIYNFSKQSIQKITDIINNLNQELNTLKSNQVDLGNFIQSISDKIESMNYSNQFDEIKNQINSIDYNKQISDLKIQIEHKNFDKKFEDIENDIKKLHLEIQTKNYDTRFEKIENIMKNSNINKKLSYLKSQIENKNFDKKFEELENQIKNLKLEIQNINYEDNFKTISNQIEHQNFNEKIEDLKMEIQNKNYDEKFEELHNQIKNQNFYVKLSELNEQVKKIEKNKIDKKKKNNIINLEKFFIDNNKLRTFSDNELIAFQDLENLALEVIYFDETEEQKKKFGK